MRHRSKKHLRGSRDRRRKEMRALVTAAVLYERITTTQARARLVRPVLEKFITRGKSGNLAATRLLLKDMPRNAVKKVMEVLSPRYKNRAGGYSRMVHLGTFKDGTKKVALELIIEQSEPAEDKKS